MVLILIGVSGSGKTTVGSKLAEALGWRYFEADDFHPPENVAKMSQGIPLSDADRAPWLAAMHQQIRDLNAAGEPGVMTCSALKQAYREALAGAEPDVHFVYLRGDLETIQGRLNARRDHFMPPGLLASQFRTLEEPAEALVIDIRQAPEAIVREIREGLGL